MCLAAVRYGYQSAGIEDLIDENKVDVLSRDLSSQMITIYFDGLCYPRNPGGVAAYGYLIYSDGVLLQCGFGTVGEGRGMTNNVAEYEGLKAAAQWIDDHEISDSIEIKGDSQLVIKQMRGDWEIRSDTSRKYVPEIRRMLEGKDVRFIWIPRERNEEADQLSRKAYEAYRNRSSCSRRQSCSGRRREKALPPHG